MRDRLVQAITEKLEAPAVLVIEHSDSAKENALQAADAVVWSLFQKYERGDEELYEIIKGKIVVEEVLRE